MKRLVVVLGVLALAAPVLAGEQQEQQQQRQQQVTEVQPAVQMTEAELDQTVAGGWTAIVFYQSPINVNYSSTTVSGNNNTVTTFQVNANLYLNGCCRL